MNLNRRTYAECQICGAGIRIEAEDHTGSSAAWLRAQGWSVPDNLLAKAKCSDCRGKREPTPRRRLQLRAATVTQADIDYRARAEARRQADLELLARIGEQHRASIPAQPIVERLRPPVVAFVGRSGSRRGSGESQ